MVVVYDIWVSHISQYFSQEYGSPNLDHMVFNTHHPQYSPHI